MTEILNKAAVEAEAQRESVGAGMALEHIRGMAAMVRSSEDIAAVSPLLQHIKGDMKRLKERKERITKPLNEALKEIRDFFRPAEQRLEEAEVLLKSAIGAAQKAIYEANRIAQLQTQQALQQGDVRLAAQVSGAIQGTEAPAGLSFRERFTYRVVNAAVIPREFLMPDDKRIKDHVSKHGMANPIPGILVEPEVQVVARAT